VTFLLVAPILLTLTLLTSGAAKCGGRRVREATVDAMTSLRLPIPSLHPLIAVVLPIAEIVLAVTLWLPWRGIQTVVACLVAVLMFAYLVIIARALCFPETVHCSCFGSLGSPTVSSATLARNVVLSVLGVTTVVLAAGGTLEQALRTDLGAAAGLALSVLVAVLLTVFTLGGSDRSEGAGDEAATAPAATTTPATAGRAAAADRDSDAARPDTDPRVPAPEDADPEDYVRLPIPFGVIVEKGNRLRTTNELLRESAQLLIWINPGCGPCERILTQVPQWEAALTPMVQLRVLFGRPVDALAPGTLERAGSHPAHDLEQNVLRSLHAGHAPAAVLLGVDGLTAGGPVDGPDAVRALVQELIAEVAAIGEGQS
jgi:hypothetical protein